ncbi:DUF1365 domain-containing protein [Agitococcus lubricus]|uniref:DUF1365 family protein n=1 Tax=Agitococcus lubricus TaxID=1077255 RepID=A0A2T5IVJ6_9GAMM|nr:DUF1365 domain-containing protein [Agitococcus lubricus]PTQ87905.1 hypothetical protein C8N29_11672 [Agitococcus lubricus]
MNEWLYTGTVAHKRLGLAAHAFQYPALFLCFPLSARQELKNACFGYNRFNLFSFHEADHGDTRDCEQWVRRILADHQLNTLCQGDIWLQTQPRILGFVFNPVSFWYCHDKDEQLRAVLCEVNNTFGERHCYLLTAPEQAVISSTTALQCQKIFHVSPFFPVEGEYRFRFYQQGQQRSVSINYWQHQELKLKTVVTGKAMPLSASNLLKSLLHLGWSTVLVVLRIHWQALKLWRKGAHFYRKPTKPSLEISS